MTTQLSEKDKQILENFITKVSVILGCFLIGAYIGAQLVFSYTEAKEKPIREAQEKIMEKELIESKAKLKLLEEKYKDEIEEEKRIAKINVFTLNYEDIEILAMNNYYESRGVGKKNWKKKRKDMENITSVVLNRYDSGKYGNSIKKVIQGAKKKRDGKWVCQFSWVCDNSKPVIDKNSKEWKLAYEVAFDVYTGITQRTVKSKALHYYNPATVTPIWATKGKEVSYVVGGHRIIIID